MATPSLNEQELLHLLADVIREADLVIEEFTDFIESVGTDIQDIDRRLVPSILATFPNEETMISDYAFFADRAREILAQRRVF